MCAGAWSAHTYPQAPQFVRLDCPSVSQPSVAAPSQSRYPVLHATPHTPAVQVRVAFTPAAGQTFEQPPQRFTSVLVSVSQPSRLTFSLALQSFHVVGQLMLHALPLHVAVPW